MIIGLDGIPGAGKDTVADILVKVGFTKIAFADALREAVVNATGFPLSTFIDRSIKDAPFGETYTLSSTVLTKFCIYLSHADKVQEVIDQFSGQIIDSPRHLLQILGTEVGRSMLSQTIWLDKYDEKRAGLTNVVTPDARFDNEKRHIQSTRGGLVWLIKRVGLEYTGSHVSEQQKWTEDKYDVVITNDNLVQLRNDVGMWWSLKGSNLR